MSQNVSVASGLTVRGIITVETRDAETGLLIAAESSVNENIITDAGLAQLAKFLAQGSFSTGYTIKVGTGTNAATASDTDLQTSVFSGTPTQQAYSGATATFKLFLGVNDANGSTLTEAGLFCDSVNIDRALFSSSVTKTSGKTVTVIIALLMSR